MTNTVSYDDENIFREVAKGDESAFRQLFYTWQPFLSAHIYRITESLEITEEIVHDVFLKIWQTRETLVEIKSFKAYLLVISRNHALNVLQKRARELASLKKYEHELSLPETEDPQAKYYTLIDEAIDQLAPRQKEVYLLSRHKRLTYQQVADTLGIGRESVKTHLENATRQISKYIHQKL